MSRVPALLSVSQFADWSGLERHHVEYQIKRGRIETMRFSPNGKHLIPLSVVKRDFPHVWDAILARLSIIEGDVFDDLGIDPNDEK